MPIRVSLLQTDIVWGRPEDNRDRLGQMILSHIHCTGGTDLVVLPEMFATGFVTEPEGVAEDAPSPTLRWMQTLSRDTGAALCGSISLHLGGGDYRNRLYFVLPGGETFHYDKRHLFTYGGEHLRYRCGNDRVVVSWKGVRFLLQICYDLRFPVFSRNRGDYDAAIYVASWPSSRQDAWDTLLRARAMENQCFVLGVNRVGSDPACAYGGGTVAVDPYGRVLGGASPGKEQVVDALLDTAGLEGFRRRFPVLSDSDKFGLLNCGDDPFPR